MQSTWYSQILLLMENLYVVGALTLVAIIFRVFWVGHRKRHPLPVAADAKSRPYDPKLEVIEIGMFIPAVIIWLAVPMHPIIRTAAAIAGYFGLTILTRLLWKNYRQTHPLPAANLAPRAKDATLEVIDTIIIALVLVFGIVRPFFMQTFFIPSDLKFREGLK
jgi:hypothetical protein